jgi:DNA-binding NtrC family response regulator
MTDSETILLVTASRGNAAMLSDFFAENGFQTKTATSLDSFDAALEEHGNGSDVTVVMIDADGFSTEIWQRLERLDRIQTPFFVVSKHRDAAMERTSEHDVADISGKPLQQDVLLDTITQLIS